MSTQVFLMDEHSNIAFEAEFDDEADAVASLLNIMKRHENCTCLMVKTAEHKQEKAA